MPPLELEPLWRGLEEIVAIGNRFAGTDGERACRELLVGRFRELGLADVRTEEFTFLGYEPETASCTVAGEGWSIPAVALQYSADGVAEADAVYVGAGRPEDVAAIEARGVDLAGKIVVAHSYHTWLVAPYLVDKGIAGLVNVSDTQDGLIGHFPVALYPEGLEAPWAGRVQAAPGVTIAAPEARRLLSLLSSGAVRLRIEHRGRYVEQTSANVIGVIGGTDLAEERAVVGAHYDTQAEGPGAADDATGVASLLEIARAWRGLRPRRTIVLCAFGVEELGFWGSYNYCRRHVGELALTRGMVNLDALGLPFPGRRVVVADPEMTPFAAESAGQAGFEPEDEIDASLYAWGDHNPFIDAGVPAVWLWRYPPQHPYYHSSGDVLRYVDPDRTLDVATACAFLAFRLATEPDLPLGRSRPTRRFLDLRP